MKRENKSWLEDRLIGIARLEPSIRAIWAYTEGEPFNPFDRYIVHTFYVFDDSDIVQGNTEELKGKAIEFYKNYIEGIAQMMQAAGGINFTPVRYEYQFKIPKEAEQIWERISDARANKLDGDLLNGK